MLSITNGAAFHIESSITASPADPGALVEVAGDMIVASAGFWVYPNSHPTNGAAVLFRVNRLLLPTTGVGFDARGRGHMGGLKKTALPVEPRNGKGPGGGAFIYDGHRGGGGYGGGGGGAMNGYGLPYGDRIKPMWAGSGGAGGDGVGGNGGGSVLIEAMDEVLISGSIIANGNMGALYSGGGSGGGIWIVCKKFTGSSTAVMSANGANGANWGGGRGGGGRIAVWHDLWGESKERLLNGEMWPAVQVSSSYDNYLGSVTVAQGTGGSELVPAPEPGTIVFLNLPPPPATIIIVR